MKIDEFMNKSKGLVPRVKIGSVIYIYSNDWDLSHEDSFLILDTKEDNLIEYENWEKCGSLPFDRLHEVLNLVQKLRDTPVSERFPEKKYRLRWINSSEDPTKTFITPNTYLGREKNSLDGFCWATQAKEIAEIFTESELEHLKKENPKLAPAIDAMKEPVEAKV